MQLSTAPSQVPAVFAATGTKNSIPLTAASAPAPNNATYDVGFPNVTMTPVPSGGLPPFGADFNGILNALSGVTNFASAGGIYPYNATFATQIGGYPKGALVQKAIGGYWRSTTDNNLTNPDAGGAGWVDAITPAFLASNNGYFQLQNGMILQWGQAFCVAGAQTTTAFPIAFPANCWTVAFGSYQAASAVQAYGVLNATTRTNFAWSAFTSASGAAPVTAASAGAVAIQYLAIGN